MNYSNRTIDGPPLSPEQLQAQYDKIKDFEERGRAICALQRDALEQKLAIDSEVLKRLKAGNSDVIRYREASEWLAHALRCLDQAERQLRYM